MALRWLTAGESHGEALVGIIEGVPAGVELTSEMVRDALARRRLGYGRGARMKFEEDKVRILGGVRHGVTQGGPIALEIANTEWPKWVDVMSSDPVDPALIEGRARNAALTRPRPGHADFTGMQKYNFAEARPVLERASARETAARVALGVVAAQVLKALGVELVSHTVAVGGVHAPDGAPVPTPNNVQSLDADPLRCFDAATSQAMVARVDEAHKDGETLGGVVEVLAYGMPPGLGSYVHWDRRLDARLAAALMGIQAIKGVEVGDGFATADRPGTAAHDEISVGEHGVKRDTNRAGGIEGGISNGSDVRVRAAFKPISTVPRALRTVDLATGEPAAGLHQRSDVCAVVPGAVIAQAMTALVLADLLLDKTGGDSVDEARRNLRSYLDRIAERTQWRTER